MRNDDRVTKQRLFSLGAYSTKAKPRYGSTAEYSVKPYSGSVKITWCGVGGGNGTGALNIGDNFSFPGIGGLYERMDIFAGGNVGTGDGRLRLMGQQFRHQPHQQMAY